MKKLILLLLFVIHSVFAGITVGVKPSRVMANDDFQLLFTYEGRGGNVVPDFSPLEKDFEILATRKSTNISIINNQVKAKTQWVVTLNAKRPGEVIIPAIMFGNESSDAVKLTVHKARYAPKENGQLADVFMQTEVSKKSAYVQSQIIYRVKLFYNKTISSGNFSQPQAANDPIVQLGNDKSYQTRINGKRYQVHERTYAIFPEHSGELQIKAPVFQGIMQRENVSNLNQILMDVHKPVKVQAKDTIIDVLPIPKDYKSAIWLPAKNITLKESWQGLTDKVKVGQPITRVITLKAYGLTAEQLPSFDFNKIKGANVYPQKSQDKNLLHGEKIIGEKTFKIVYIPTREGSLTIPKQELPWWNIDKDKKALATIEGKKLNIVKGASYDTTNQNTIPPTQKHTTHKQAKPTSLTQRANSHELSHNVLLPWTLTIILSLSWVAHFLLKAKSKQRKKSSSTNIVHSEDHEKNHKAKLKKACVDNNNKAAYQTLLSWGKHHWPHAKVTSLSDIKTLANNAKFNETIDTLERSIYGKEHQWSGHSLWVSWLAVVEKKRSKSSKGFKLPPLNPKKL